MTNRIAVNESMREHAINAAGSGHDLTGFDLVQDQDGQMGMRYGAGVVTFRPGWAI